MANSNRRNRRQRSLNSAKLDECSAALHTVAETSAITALPGMNQSAKAAPEVKPNRSMTTLPVQTRFTHRRYSPRCNSARPVRHVFNFASNDIDARAGLVDGNPTVRAVPVMLAGTRR